MGRRRLYIVVVRTDLCFEFAWPTPQVHPIRLLDIIGPAPPGAHLNEPPVGARGGRHERDRWAVHSETLRDRGVQPDEPWLVNLHETLPFAILKKRRMPVSY